VNPHKEFASTVHLLNKHVAPGNRNSPQVSSVSQKEILENHLAIKRDVQAIVQTEMERMLDTPELTDLIIKKS
jgi:hypothetical protein